MKLVVIPTVSYTQHLIVVNSCNVHNATELPIIITTNITTHHCHYFYTKHIQSVCVQLVPTDSDKLNNLRYLLIVDIKISL